MGNMSYCRFENTYGDLQDCYDHMDEVEEMSDSEKKYRRRLIELCQNIFDDYGDELDEDFENE